MQIALKGKNPCELLTSPLLFRLMQEVRATSASTMRRELVRLGHEVHVFTALMPGAPETESTDGVRIHRLRPVARMGNVPLLPSLLSGLRSFDVIHLHVPFILGAEITALAATLHRTPLVVTYHNDLVKLGTWRDLVFSGATWSLRHVVLRRANRVLFVSQGHAETNDLHDIAGQPNVYVVPNGVDTDIFRPSDDRAEVRCRVGVPADAQVVGFVGCMDLAHHYKGLDVLLQAMTLLKCRKFTCSPWAMAS